MANDTKERILDTALCMFSDRGYEGANIRELSEAVGLTKSAFYKHYKSKEEVWDMVIREMSAYYEANFGSEKNLPVIPKNASELSSMTLRMFLFTIQDPRVVTIRKILMTEQFRDDRVRKLATKHFNQGIEAMFTRIFEGMMMNGSLKKGDAAILAFSYTAPISTLVQLCDREPGQKDCATEKAKVFIAQFISVYGGEQ